MPTTRYRGPPMTLANMRAQRVRSLGVPAQWFAARIVCTTCGIPGADARPNSLSTWRFALS
jgi:hypothetical protein